jgi:hypothetical protein
MSHFGATSDTARIQHIIGALFLKYHDNVELNILPSCHDGMVDGEMPLCQNTMMVPWCGARGLMVREQMPEH